MLKINSVSLEDENDKALEENFEIVETAQRKEEINNSLQISNYSSVDSEVETSEIPTELDILGSVKNKNCAIDYNEDDDPCNHDDEIKKSSHSLKLFQTI